MAIAFASSFDLKCNTLLRDEYGDMYAHSIYIYIDIKCRIIRVIKTQPMDLRCDYNDCATIMLIWLAGYWQRTIAKINIEWSTQANNPASQAASQPDKEMKWQKEHNNNKKSIQPMELDWHRRKICGHSSFHSVTLINACLIKRKLIAQWVQSLAMLSLFNIRSFSIITIYSLSALAFALVLLHHRLW